MFLSEVPFHQISKRVIGTRIVAHTVIVPESRQTNLLLALVTKRLAEQLQRIANALTTYVIAAAVKLHTGSNAP